MNPKLEESNIIDCIPQIGECPRRCSECFYNGGRFFRPLDTPLIPTVEDAKNKIVRVNSGNDSNNNKYLVIEKTKQFQDKFYNTSIPDFDFPGPVVFTCNPKNKVILVKPTDNLMFVRVRANSWDFETMDTAIDHYWNKFSIPVVITFMRYYNGNLIPESAKDDYEWKKHIINSYYCIKPIAIINVMKRYNKTGVKMCGTPYSSFCVDCGNCENLYYLCISNLEELK